MISVIVPIYHGRNYIKNIIGMVERNAMEVCEPVEIIFVNDSPEDAVEDVCVSSVINIVLLNNAGNRGIHYSRIQGIRHSHGKYVLMLDQDDTISDYFLSSQTTKIGNADMIVANGYEELRQGRRILYQYALMQWTVRYGIFYTVFGSRILSPGQCLIRKESIPELWFQDIIKNNGADDYLLWIYMLAGKCKIRINRETLYVHGFTGNNSSGDWEKMELSRQEVIHVARENNALSPAAYRYIADGAKKKQTVFRKIVGCIIKTGNAINRQ